jgi:hypothetical protein
MDHSVISIPFELVDINHLGRSSVTSSCFGIDIAPLLYMPCFVHALAPEAVKDRLVRSDLEITVMGSECGEARP